MPKKNPTSVPAAPTPSATDTPALTPAASTALSLLDEHYGTTAAELADRTGLGRSTVTKALAALHEAGLAVRQEGGHEGTRRVADRWFAAPGQATPAADGEAEDVAADDYGLAESEAMAGSTDDSPADTISDGGADDAADEPSASTLPEAEVTGDDIEKDEPLEVQPQGAAETGTESVGSPDTAKNINDAIGDSVPEDDAARDESAEPTAVEPCGAGLDETGEANPEAREDADEADTEPVEEAIDQAEGNGSGTSDSDSGVDLQPEGADAGGPDLAADDGTGPEAAQAVNSGPRLGKGELRAMIEAHMCAHPDLSFSATVLHHIFNRSSGAIANACEILVKEGKAVVAQEKKPRRFQWNTDASAETA